jgi:hypothetical protein
VWQTPGRLPPSASQGEKGGIVMTRVRVLSAILILGGLGISGPFANAQGVCPPVGQDNNCATIITITDTGASISTTGQGPFDGIEDTLIGVVNNSSQPVRALGLKSALPIFAFDGDGLVAFGVPGNALDGSGYGGPNAYFTNIDPSLTAGTVNFIVPVPANAGITFFSLEEDISSVTACSSLINNSVPKPPSGGTTIQATFTPQVPGYTISQAAQVCGFKNFNWQQIITSWPKPSALFSARSTAPLSAPPPFNDPPPGGYAYQHPPNTAYPFYYNLFTPASDPLSLAFNETSTTLSFYDAPANNCLPGGSGASCGGKTALRGSKLAFTTHLVGVLPDNSLQDLGIGFRWTDTFNGTSGGISVSNSYLPVDPGSGTGGIAIIDVQEITTFGGISVTTVNGTPPGAPQALKAGNACDGVFSGTFQGDVTVSKGQHCTFVNGTIVGKVRDDGGNLVLTGVFVNGGMHIFDGSTFSIGPSVMIEDDLQINGLPSGTTQNQICDATVQGNLTLLNNAASVQIGSSSPSACPGNVIGGNLEADYNTGSVFILGNTVTGFLNLNHNVGSTQVFGNTVSKDLSCGDNSSITGTGNTAVHKLGQCVNF